MRLPASIFAYSDIVVFYFWNLLLVIKLEDGTLRLALSDLHAATRAKHVMVGRVVLRSGRVFEEIGPAGKGPHP